MIKIKFLFIILLVITLSLSALGICFVSTNYASADESVSSFYLPETPLEYKELNSPVDVYHDDTLTAIAQKEQLFVYKNKTYLNTSSLSFTTLKQVRRLNENTLLLIDNAILYSLNIDTKVKTELKDTNGEPISGNYFDINDSYLVTAFGTKALFYRIKNNKFEKLTTPDVTVKNDLPITINDNNQVFFVDSKDGICKVSLGSSGGKIAVFDANPEKMIANTKYVYYIENSQIFAIEIATNLNTNLSFSDIDSAYTLGSPINAPIGLSFKEENLLILDASSVQEYKIQKNQLIFTGFAIASKRSAFNRVGTTAIDVEKNGDTIATLDKFKLTVFNSSENYYDRDNFDNYLATDLGGSMPHAFALGNNLALLIYGQNTSGSSLRFLNLETRELYKSDIIFTGNIIRDACYQSGYYYVLVSNGSTSSVYKYSERDMTKLDLKIPSLGNGYTKISVDVFGNIYLANDTNIFRLSKANSYIRSSILTISGTKKIINDLSGKLFVLTASGLGYVENNTLISVYKPTLTNNEFTSFAMDFVDEKVYFIYDNEELLSSAIGLKNYAITSIAATDNYVTTSSFADINKLKIYKVGSGANVYSVTEKNKKFTFNNLIEEPTEYVYICDINVTNGFTITALAGQEGVVLVNSKEIVKKTVNMDAAPAAAYTATGVNMYFLPVITKNGEFSLSDNSSIIRLDKSTAITPEKIFTFLDREYYYATATVNGVTYSGYVPTAFTVEILAKDFTWNEFTMQSISKTKVYSDKEMTEELMTFNDGQQVKLVVIENDVAQICFSNGDGTLSFGYIPKAAIKNPQSVPIRTVIIIMALSISAFGSALYFLLRKKRW